METSTRQYAATALGALTAFGAATFLFGSASHLGTRIPLGVAEVREPRIIPATIVEGVCGLALAASAYGQFARKPWAWPATVAAHGVALGGVLLGMAALAAGRGPRSELNDAYHRLMLGLLSGELTMLTTSGAKAALADGARA